MDVRLGVSRRDSRARTCTTRCERTRSPARRLVTLHNLNFIARLMTDLRSAIDADRLPETRPRRCAPVPHRALLRVPVDQALNLRRSPNWPSWATIFL